MATATETIRKGVEFIRDWLTEKLEPRIARIEQRLDGVEQRLGGVEQRLGGVENRLGALEVQVREDLKDLKRDQAVIVTRLDDMDKRFDDLAAMHREVLRAVLVRSQPGE